MAKYAYYLTINSIYIIYQYVYNINRATGAPVGYKAQNCASYRTQLPVTIVPIQLLTSRQLKVSQLTPPLTIDLQYRPSHKKEPHKKLSLRFASKEEIRERFHNFKLVWNTHTFSRMRNLLLGQ